MKDISLSYETLRSLIAAKPLLWQYVDQDDRYNIFACDGNIQYTTVIYKPNASIGGINAEQEAQRVADFEGNYKESANGLIGSSSLSVDIRFPIESYITTNAYATARPVNGDFEVRRYKSKTIYIENLGLNAASIKVLGNFTNASGIENTIVLMPATSLALANGVQVTDDTPYETIQIQAKSAVAGLSTTIKTRGYALGA